MIDPAAALTEAQDRVLRLTGQQIDSIDPPPDGDWFVDFDEYEEFVEKRRLDYAEAKIARLRPIEEATRMVRERLDIDPGNVKSWAEWDTLDAALEALP